MFELKPISPEAIPEALEKVERYRLLNEPAQAESICLDILRVDPENQTALIMLLLALTDQLGLGGASGDARAVIPRLKGEYDRAYYTGIICERMARALLDDGVSRRCLQLLRWISRGHGVVRKGADAAPAGQ